MPITSVNYHANIHSIEQKDIRGKKTTQTDNNVVITLFARSRDQSVLSKLWDKVTGETAKQRKFAREGAKWLNDKNLPPASTSSTGEIEEQKAHGAMVHKEVVLHCNKLSKAFGQYGTSVQKEESVREFEKEWESLKEAIWPPDAHPAALAITFAINSINTLLPMTDDSTARKVNVLLRELISDLNAFGIGIHDPKDNILSGMQFPPGATALTHPTPDK